MVYFYLNFNVFKIHTDTIIFPKPCPNLTNKISSTPHTLSYPGVATNSKKCIIHENIADQAVQFYSVIFVLNPSNNSKHNSKHKYKVS